jgi:hypothetical protein
MSPTYGNAPPALGAADIHVDPQALWDVGLALQRVRDAAQQLRVLTGQASRELDGVQISADLTEVWRVWQDIHTTLSGPPCGLTKQLDGLVAALDTMMINLRDNIVAYVVSESESRRRMLGTGR